MAEAMLERKRQVLIKLEAVSGTPETLAAPEGKMRVAVKPDVTPDNKRNARDVARATMTNLPGIPGAKSSSIKWRCELVGSGSVSTPPAEDAALQASGMVRAVVNKVPIGTISGGTFLRGDIVTATGGKSGVLLISAIHTAGFLFMRVTAGSFATSDVCTNGTASATASGNQAVAGYSYKPLTNAPPTATIRSEEDGYQKSISGAAVTWKMSIDANKQGFWDFEAKGPNISYGDLALTSGITYYSTLPPILQSALMRLDTYTAVLKSFGMDIANSVPLREDGNAGTGIKGARIASRRPMASAGIEMMNASDYDIYNKFLDGVDVKVQCRVGSVIGNSWWFFGDRANFSGLGQTGTDGLVVVTPEMELNGFDAGGDDELEVLAL